MKRHKNVYIKAIALVFALAMVGEAKQRRLYWHGDSSQKKVALTFDDGPNEPYTSQILKILKENNVHATFFMVGKNVETYPDAARAVATEHHAIGNHSYDHRDLLKRTMI